MKIIIVSYDACHPLSRKHRVWEITGNVTGEELHRLGRQFTGGTMADEYTISNTVFYNAGKTQGYADIFDGRKTVCRNPYSYMRREVKKTFLPENCEVYRKLCRIDVERILQIKNFPGWEKWTERMLEWHPEYDGREKDEFTKWRSAGMAISFLPNKKTGRRNNGELYPHKN